MTTTYDRRLVALEQRHYRATVPAVRIIDTIISPETHDAEGVYLEDKHFDRAEGETVAQLERGAMRAVGWDD